jgi:oxygen-independent coproporphyrinogen-3 oxidase
MGAQSFDSDELIRLGRIHDAERPAKAFELARAHGFARLSLDLMFGFPGNDARRLEATLDRALALEPEHVSAYCFIPEAGTPLGDAVGRGAQSLPSGDEQADLYWTISERLARAGHRCYETSNFCIPGGEARHNLVYWLRRPYLGLGPSAHGLLRGVRYGNHYALSDWAAALEHGARPESEVEPATARSVATEVMMLGLRLCDGLQSRDYSTEVWQMVSDRYSLAFARGLATGRLESTAAGVRIPERHRFVADDIIAWIEAIAERPRFDRGAAPYLTSMPCPSLPSPAV